MTDEAKILVSVSELKALIKVAEAADLADKAKNLGELNSALIELQQALAVLKLDVVLQELTRSGHNEDAGNGGG